MERPTLVEPEFLNSLYRNKPLINIRDLDIEIPNVTEGILKTKKDRSMLFNWIVLLFIIFIIYLLYLRFKNSDPEPNLDNLPPSIRNNKYHKGILKKKKIENQNNTYESLYVPNSKLNYENGIYYNDVVSF
jgi:hypothetical protein